MKHFQLPESNKSMIPLVECIFLSAAMPVLVYTVVWASQTPNNNAANKQQPRVSKQWTIPQVVLLYTSLWPKEINAASLWNHFLFSLAMKQIS